MHSAGHRANILDRASRRSASASPSGAPVALVRGELGGTYVTDFGAGCALTARGRAARVARRHGRRPAPARPALRPRRRSARSTPSLAALRRHRPRAARASWPRARPTTSCASTCPRASRAATPTPNAARLFERWQQEGAVVRDDEPALWALTQDYTGPDGRTLHAPRLLRARARRGLRPRAHPPARAHAPRPQGGPPAAHARDAGEPLADLQPLRRPGRRGLERAVPHTPASRAASRPTTTAPSTASGASPTRRDRGRAARRSRPPSC